MVYLKCGHVHGQHDWGIRNRSVGVNTSSTSSSVRQDSHNQSRESSSLDLNSDLDLRECPLCRKVNIFIQENAVN